VKVIVVVGVVTAVLILVWALLLLAAKRKP
jgi:hypothetical protein